jgi:hypothetical protein
MIDRLKTIAADPFARHANVEPLKGERDAFRVRQGDWRAELAPVWTGHLA